jgi:glycosyltransferase involved in cell wall biosynthesis
MSVYNGEPFLEDTVKSILDQTVTDFEFIVIDDGSTDNTWDTLSSYASKDARLILLRNQPNAGVVRSLNMGLDRSKGDIIVRQDADDISHPERLKRQLDFLQTHRDYGLVAAVPQLIDINGTPLELSGWNATENQEIQSKLLDYMCLCGPSIVIRRECLEAAGFYFSEGLDASEDYDLCLRLAEVTKLAGLEGSLYQYRQHPQSASRTQEQRQAFNKAIALERAVYRRFGPTPGVEKFACVGKDYLRAAVIGIGQKDIEHAHKCLSHALEVYSPLLDSDRPLEDLVRAYTPAGSIDDALEYTRSVFDDLLQPTRRLVIMKSRLLSYIHMSQVFSDASQHRYRQVRKHLWQGIRNSPNWLLNRGVIAILFRDLFIRGFMKP